MRKVFVIPFLFLFLTGCAAQLQDGISKLDAHWRAENKSLMAQLGTRYYKLDKQKAQTAMLMALSNLELTIEQQDANSGFILAKGNAPRPLDAAEWKRVVDIETPTMHSIAGPFVTLTGDNYDVIVNSIMFERPSDIQVNLRFRVKFTGNTHGLIVGDQAPPEAIRIGIPKVWDEFEKIAFVQGKVIYGKK